MNLSPLTALSPIDGRYHQLTKELAAYFSEFALIKARVHVEVLYFIALCKIPLPQLKNVDPAHLEALSQVYQKFSLQDALAIKNIEQTTNHDVKAVEYFVKEKLAILSLDQYKEFIHFGLTSQDINNTAIPYLFKQFIESIYLPSIDQLVQLLKNLASNWSEVVMLARTHGQPASPTRLGKELLVFVERIEAQLKQLDSIPFSAKFGGATGNFNAHYVAYPMIDWTSFANHFVQDILQLKRSQYTTQIEHYDNFAAHCDLLKRINTILMDLNRDMWQYISMDYFKQKIKPGEIGSSAMPHKVNPIDFENSEGNLGLANALLTHFSAKLPISRLQRDLTDSTVLRNIGVPMAHTLIAIQSTLKGLNKLVLHQEAIEKDLQANWAVVAEAIQTILRREGVSNPYERLKDLTRTGKPMSVATIASFVDQLDIPASVKQEIKNISPSNYTGK